ncbi:PREDICTED: uncharacterized protein LOC106117785 isoform X2 [Papilio xuthus]|uniref:Uncharacterized protein LOC106117785 isoform X2 n=1 Tax=Papilio xuthus TaxID=66420 RepID=A0AAJ7E941_PAPXU|nr:PREDICTED: uncharacterized protein LOC106117785 isoform X2 [Papilio xuthus]
MEKERKFIAKRTDVLRKLNAESLQLIERGLLGDLPDKLKPPPLVPPRGQSTELAIAKPSGLLSSCLPVPDSPKPQSDDDVSPLKKTFSFRDKFSRISFLKKDKEKAKWKNEEDETNPNIQKDKEQEYKSSKRFWFFRNKELLEKKKQHKPIYKRSKSFEFLPRAIEEETEDSVKNTLTKNQSYAFGSNDTMADAWSSTESLEYLSNVYYDNDDSVFLKSIKEFPSESSNNNSSISNATSASSGLVVNIMRGKSMQDLLDEFEKAVDMFSENYMSDCEPYTKTNKELSVKEKRLSSSLSNLPSPKVMVTKVNQISDDFKAELSKLLSVKSVSGARNVRRGSVTDWFVLEDKNTSSAEQNKYRRAQKKPTQRVRRISSTKYWITPEECAVYSRERRPPLVIPRITQYRAPRRDIRQQNFTGHTYEESAKEWSPASERGALGYSKLSAESPPFVRINKKLGGSTENLIVPNLRPSHLHLPASSSGDSLDVEVRDKEPAYSRSRKSRSMVAHKRSPVPAPRRVLPPTEVYERAPEPVQSASSVVDERLIKRTKYSESGKKSKKNWSECYMVLTHTALYFYKDQRTYNATKIRKPGTPPSPTAPRAELILPLRNAHVLPCIQAHTRRYTRSFTLTVGYDTYLLQDESDDKAKQLLMLIQNIIYKLGPPTLEEYPPQYQSSNTDLESLGRTPPVARHARHKKAGGSSNEDLSDSTEVSTQKSQVTKVLRKFFPKRPTMEDLVKKGIYKDEPVFGRKLEEVCSESSPRVPEFVRACVREIESTEENMSTDGLYRASGNLSQVQKIRLEIDQKNQSVISNNTDIHVLTGALKLFFRELKEPLIPCTMFDRVLAACSIKPREARIKEFREIVNCLPECNRDTLKFLLEHLLKVTQYSERNRMHTANLAIVFGPTLLWAPAAQAHNIAVDCIQQNNVVDILLNDYHDIFDRRHA